MGTTLTSRDGVEDILKRENKTSRTGKNKNVFVEEKNVTHPSPGYSTGVCACVCVWIQINHMEGIVGQDDGGTEILC